MDLIIVQTVNNISLLKNHISKSTDLLVFSHEVMISLDQNNIQYKVIEDFYNIDQYYEDIPKYHQIVKKLFYQLDKSCEKELFFPFCYSGNEQYFLPRFDDLFYLERMISQINNRYNKIYLYSSIKPNNSFENHLDFSKFNSRKVNGTISFALEKSNDKMMELIYNSMDVSFVNDEFIPQKKIPLINIILKYINRSVLKIKREFHNKNFDLTKKIKKEIFYVINEGYELNSLKKYLSKFRYINPTTALRKEIESEKPHDVSNIYIDDILKNFINSNFFFLNKYLYIFLNSYHFEIVGRIGSFNVKFEDLIKKNNPSLVLLSTGTRDVFDTICCYISNKFKIPVMLFQHGGTTSLHNSYYSEPLEYNKRVSKILISQSKKDFSKMNNEYTKVLNMGSIQDFEKINLFKNEKITKKVLFCLGPDTDTSFRSLYSVNQKHNHSLDIIFTANKALLPIDIKLHPTGEQNSYHCYSNIIKQGKYKNINIIYGNFVELISKNYNLFIVDYLGSAIIKHIICLKVPIIIYGVQFKNKGVDKSVMDDIYKRFYIAEDKTKLLDFLIRYKNGELPSKWSEEIIDNYIYPLNKGNPGENIAQYIENSILN